MIKLGTSPYLQTNSSPLFVRDDFMYTVE